MQEWILPLAGVGVIMPAVFLFLRSRDRAAMREQEWKTADASTAQAAELRSAIDALREELSRQEETWALTREAPRASLNFRRTSQVVRLFRRGESVPGIASNLDMRRNEVDLILRTQQLIGASAKSIQSPKPSVASFR